MNGPSIIARLGLDAGEFKKGIKDAKGLLLEFAGVLGVGFGVAGLANMVKGTLDFAGALQDTSDELNISVEALQGLQGAFEQSGASGEVVTKGLVKLNQNLQEAKDGSEKAIQAFSRLGVSWRDIQGLGPEEILGKIADAVKDSEDPTESLAAVMDILGKSGAKMIAGLKGGGDALNELRAHTAKMSQEEIEALDNAGDAIARFQRKAMVLFGMGISGEMGWQKKASTWLANLISQETGNGALAQEVIDGYSKEAEASGKQAQKSAASGGASKGAPFQDKKDRDLATEKEVLGIRGKHGDEEDLKIAFAKYRAAKKEADKEGPDTSMAEAANKAEEAWLNVYEIIRNRSKQTQEVEQQTADIKLKSSAEIIGLTSKRAQAVQEIALTEKQIADKRNELGFEPDALKRAAIQKDLVGLEAQRTKQVEERARFEAEMDRTMARARASIRQSEVESLAMTDRDKADKEQIAIWQEQIAINARETFTADENRLVELVGQNAELQQQINHLRLIRQMESPQERRARREEERRVARAQHHLDAQDRTKVNDDELRRRQIVADEKARRFGNVPHPDAVRRAIDKPKPVLSIDPKQMADAIDLTKMAGTINTRLGVNA